MSWLTIKKISTCTHAPKPGQAPEDQAIRNEVMLTNPDGLLVLSLEELGLEGKQLKDVPPFEIAGRALSAASEKGWNYDRNVKVIVYKDRNAAVIESCSAPEMNNAHWSRNPAGKR